MHAQAINQAVATIPKGTPAPWPDCVHNHGDLSVDEESMPAGGHSSRCSKDRRDKGLFGCLRIKLFRLRIGFPCHYPVSDDAEYGVQYVDVLLRLHGACRQQYHPLYLGCCTGGGPCRNLHEDLKRPHTGTVDSQQFGVSVPSNLRAAWREGPGLKPLVFAGFFAGLKPCASTRKAKVVSFLAACGRSVSK